MSDGGAISVRGLPPWVVPSYAGMEILRQKIDRYPLYVRGAGSGVPCLGNAIMQAYRSGDDGFDFNIRPDYIAGIIWAATDLFGVAGSKGNYNPLKLKISCKSGFGLNNWMDGILLLNARIQAFSNRPGSIFHLNGGYDPCYEQESLMTSPFDLEEICSRLTGKSFSDVQPFVQKVLYYADKIHWTEILPDDPVVTNPPPAPIPTKPAPNPPSGNNGGGGGGGITLPGILPPVIERPLGDIANLVKQNWWVIPAAFGAFFVITPYLKKQVRGESVREGAGKNTGPQK